MFAFALSAISQTTAKPSDSRANEQLSLKSGQEALKSGDIASARKEFEKAVRLAPNDASAQSALGWVFAQQGEADAAIGHLRAALKAKPDFIDAQLTLAGVLAKQGKFADAEQEARTAVKTAPQNAESHRMLARILSQRPGDDAIAEMKRAVELAPERADLRDEL